MFVVFLAFLLSAPIVAQSSMQLLSAAVGGSAHITCSLPGNPLGVQWFYWQEDGTHNMLYHWDIDRGTQNASEEYKDRVHAFNTESEPGNISIRLDNVAVGDDGKTFWAFACVSDGQRSRCRPSEQMCHSKLQVSAPYRDLHLTVNNTANVATCTARGGYPAAQVSWTGQNRSSGAHLDLQGAETSLPQDPTEKTFSITSSVGVKDLHSVTCLVYNPRSNQEIYRTSEVHAPDENQQRVHPAVIVPVVVLILILIIIIIIISSSSRSRSNSVILRLCKRSKSS